MNFVDYVDFFYLDWSFDLPSFVWKCLQMSLWNWVSCFNRLLSVNWLPYDYLHERWHVLTNKPGMTMADVPWGFELLRTDLSI